MGNDISQLNANLAAVGAALPNTEAGRGVGPSEVRNIVQAAGGRAHAREAVNALVDINGYDRAQATRMVFPHMSLRAQGRLLASNDLTGPQKAVLLQKLTASGDDARASALLRRLPLQEQVSVLGYMDQRAASAVLERYNLRGSHGTTLRELFMDTPTTAGHSVVFARLSAERRSELVHALPADAIAHLMPTLSGERQAEVVAMLPDRDNAGPTQQNIEAVAYYLHEQGTLDRVLGHMSQHDADAAQRLALST